MMNPLTVSSPLVLQSLVHFLPEFILATGLLVLLVLTVLKHKKSDEDNEWLMSVALVFVAGSIASLAVLGKHYADALSGGAGEVVSSVLSGIWAPVLLGLVVRLMLLVGAGLTVAMSHRFLAQTTRVVGDFYILVLGATLGGMFLASATDLVMVFVGLETLSITSYVLAGYLRKTALSAEASLKYLVYGGMGTAVFLFALSLMYGLAGSTGFVEIARTLQSLQGSGHPLLMVMLVMSLAAVAFKLSLVPFHMWTPDVYEGAPTPVSGFLSVVSKSAAFALAIRLLYMLFSGMPEWVLLLSIFAIFSMVLGNVVALKQTSLKRLLAYSTIAHAGYMVLGLLVEPAVGVSGVLFYLVSYLFMNLGAFASVIQIQNLLGTDDLEAVSGLVHKCPSLVLGFSLCLLSLAGIPITAGFFAKFFLFQSVMSAGGPHMLWLVVVALAASTVSLAYYVNVIRLMVVKEPSEQVQRVSVAPQMHWSLSTALTVCVLATLLLGIFATPVYHFTEGAANQMALWSKAQVELSHVPD